MKRILCLLAVLAVTQAHAQLPRLLSFQGVLADSLSQPLPDGSYGVTFSMYTQASGGSAVWIESQTLTLQRGLFTTVLGLQTLFYDSFRFDRPYWLGIRIGSEPEMTPRIQLTSAPYSFSAGRADTAKYAMASAKPAFVDSARIGGTVANNAVTSAKVADGSLQRADVAAGFTAPYADTATVARIALQGGTIDSVRIAGTIPDNSVTSAKIADGTVQRTDVQANFKAPYADTADFAASSPPGGAAGGDLAGTYPNPAIASGAVTGTKIAANAITTAKVAHGQIVKSLNGRTDSITISGANGTTVTTSNDTIYINSPGGSGSSGITGIQNTNNTLDVINPSGPTTTVNVKSLSIGATQLTDGGVTSAKIADGAVTGADIADGTIGRIDVQPGFKAPRADSADFALSASPTGSAGGDLVGAYPSPAIAGGAVTSIKILDGTIVRQDVAASFVAPYTDTADYARGAPPRGSASGDLSGTYPAPVVATGAVTGAKILDGTIARIDVQPGFKAPYADTADFATSAPPGGAAGGDLAGSYPNPSITLNAVTSGKILDGSISSADIGDGAVTSADIANATIQRADAVAAFKAPYADTADYAKAAPVSGAAGGDLAGTYPNPTIAANAVASAEILDGTVTSTDVANTTIQRVDVVASFKAPYADTADYAKAAPAIGAAGGDLTGTYPNPAIAANAVASAEILDGAVTSADITNATVQRADVVASFKAPYADTADYAKAAPAIGAAGGDLTGTYPNPTIAPNAVASAEILDGTVTGTDIANASIQRANVAPSFKAPYADTADYAKAAPVSGAAGGDLTGTYPNPTIASNAVASAEILDGSVASADIADGTVTSTDIANATIQRADAVASFKAPYADTADYARAATLSGTAGGDLTGTYPNPTIAASAVASAEILDGSVSSADITDGTVSSTDIANGAIQRADVQASFKAPFADTADYARGATLSGAAGGDLTGTYPNPTIAINTVTSIKIADGAVASADIADGSVTSADIANGTIQRADLIGAFKAPYADTADYAKAATAGGSAGGDLSGTYPNPAIASGAVNSAKILDGAIARADVQAAFKAPYSDTADFARAAPPGGAAGGSLTGTYPNPTLATGAVTTGAIQDGTILRADVGAAFKAPFADTADYARAAPPAGAAGGDLSGTYPNPTVATGAVTNAKLASNAVTTPKVAHGQLVKRLNGLTDSITIAGANGTTVNTSNDTIYISSPGDTAAGVTGIQNTNGTLDITNPNGPTATIDVKSLGIGTGQLASNAVTSAKILDGTVTGADIADATVASADITDGTVTSTDIANSTIQRIDVVAAFKAPYADTADYAKAALTSGAAGGDLSGTYPNPSVATGAITSTKILDATIANADIANSTITAAKVSSSGASSGQALIYNGTSVTWGNPAAGSLTLPFSGSGSNTATLFTVTNSTGSTSDSARAIHAIMSSTTSAPLAAGLRGENRGTNAEGFGLWGLHRGAGHGVYGSSISGRGVSAYTQTGTEGIYGQSDKSDGNGVLGYANGGVNAWGVYGSNASNGAGVAGFSGVGVGVYGYALAPGYAGKFTGDVQISGTLSKGAGSFKIDHPLDPANKYLYHSFVESPDMKNIYDGVITLDATGGATVTLPEWFEALNKDFRYQLTAVGAPGPGLYIAQEVRNNRFTIAGGTAGMKVSWQVTGIRHDAYAEKNRIPVEELKTGEERGRYLHPTAAGLGEEMGMPSDQARVAKDKNERAKRQSDGRGRQ